MFRYKLPENTNEFWAKDEAFAYIHELRLINDKWEIIIIRKKLEPIGEIK